MFVGCQKADEGTPSTGDATTSSSTPAATPAPTGGTATTAAFAPAADVFTKNCVGCHGDRPREGIDLRSYDSVMKGGEEGPIVKAGDAKGSVLVQALHGTDGKKQMPPRGPLPEEDIKKIEDWIQAGAKS